jgi:hypothetical protein
MASSKNVPAGDRNLYANDGQTLLDGSPKPPAFLLGQDDFCLPVDTRALGEVTDKGKRNLLTKKVTPGVRDGNSLTVAFTLADGETVIETATLCLPAKSKDSGILQFADPAAAPAASDENEEDFIPLDDLQDETGS